MCVRVHVCVCSVKVMERVEGFFWLRRRLTDDSACTDLSKLKLDQHPQQGLLVGGSRGDLGDAGYVVPLVCEDDGSASASA